MPRTHFHSPFKSIVALILAVVVFCVAVPTISFAIGAYDDLKQKISSKNSEIDKLESEIKAYQIEIDKLGDEKDTLSNAIQSLTITQKKLSADISVTNKKIEATELVIKELSYSISEANTSVEIQKRAIERALREMKYTTDFSFTEKILSGNDIGQILKDYDSFLQLQKAMQEKIASLSMVKERLTEDKLESELAKQDLVDLKNELSARKLLADNAKAEQQRLLNLTNNRESAYKDLVEEKSRLKKQFEDELFQYESTLEFLLDPSKLPPTGVASLQWPLNKIVITQRFGITADSKRLYKSGSHSGVDFGIPRGTKVYTARKGTVVGTGNTDLQRGCYSYGKWILVEHDNGLATLYAHMDLISVKVGQKVSTGELIGYSGNTGYSTGPHLHFGVYASEAVSIKYGTSKTCGSVPIPVASPSGYLDPMLYLPQK